MSLYSRKSARRSLFDTMMYRGLSQVVTMLSYIVIVRGMTEHEFGVLSLLYAFIPVVSMLASLGLEQTLRRFQPEYLESGNKRAAAWLVRVVASARLATNVAFLAIVLLAWNLVAPLFKLTAYRADFALFCLLILIHFQSRILQLTLASHMLHRYSVGSIAVLNAAKLVAYLGLMSFGELTLRNAILADLLANGTAYAMLKIAHLRFCTPPPAAEPFRVNAAERKRLLRYGFYNNFNDVGSLVLTSRSDNFFIAAFLDPIAVGAYSFYVRLNEMTGHLVPTRLFDNVIQPMFFATPREQSELRIPRYFSLLVNINLLWELPLAAYVVAYHREIVQVLFGGKFLDHSILLPVVVGFTTLQVFGTPATLVAQYMEKASIILYSKVFSIYNIAAMLMLLPFAGLYGAAIATGTAQLMKNLFIWWFVRRIARWTNWMAVSVSALAIWGGAVALCLGLKHVTSWPPIFDLLGGMLVVGVGWLLYIRSPAVSHSDREILGNLLHGREARILRWVGVLRCAAAGQGK
jgi:O-antigen/teichoic acid export membrane protein